MKPHIRLINEKQTSVAIGGMLVLSAIQPIRDAMAPMKNTYIIYLMVVASRLKVHFAFAKKEILTAIQKATKLESHCEKPLDIIMANTDQCAIVFIKPIDAYFANVFNCFFS